MPATSTIPWPEDQATMSLYPEAAGPFGMGRSAAYESAKKGTFPVRVIGCGNKLRVPTAELRRVLGLPVTRPLDGPRDAA